MNRFHLVAGFFAACSVIRAQDVVDDEYFNMSLEDLLSVEVVTASKNAQKATDAPATVFTVTERQIKARNYSSLKELLQDIPQIEINKYSNPRTTDSYTMNGVEGNEKFVILMDGIRVSSRTGAPFTMDESFSLINVKQVEIILGPASALYGADAFTGIINIITKSGVDDKGFEIVSSLGMFGTLDNAVSYNGGTEKVSVSLSAKHHHTDGPVMPDYYEKDFDWYSYYQETGNKSMFGDTINLGSPKNWSTPTDAYTLQGKIKAGNFTLGYSKFFESHSSAYGDNFEITSYTKDAIIANHIQTGYIQHAFTSQSEKVVLTSTVSGQDYKMYPNSKFVNQYSGYGDAYKYERNYAFKLEEQLNWNFSEKGDLVLGGSYEYLSSVPYTSDLPSEWDESKAWDEQGFYYPGTNVIDSAGNDLTIMQDVFNINYSNIGAYLQGQYKFTEKIALTAGSRYDYNSRFGSTVNPRVGLVLKPGSKFTAKILYGKAFKAPSPSISNEHYGSFFPIANGSGEVIGLGSGFWHLTNEDLKPEQRTSYDAYMLYKLTDKVAVSLNGYYGVIKDLITTEGSVGESFQGVPVGFIERYTNKGESETYGGTFRLDYVGSITDNIKANLFTTYTYSDGQIEDEPLILNAKNTVKAGLGLNFGTKLNFYLSAKYRSESNAVGSTNDDPITNDAFTVLNLSANYTIKSDNNISSVLFFRVDNLTDARYYNAGKNGIKVTPQDPLKISGGLKINFN